MDKIFKFLLGESDIDGCNFGDRHIQYKGVFWWRILLRKYLEENPTCSSTERAFLDELREKGKITQSGNLCIKGGSSIVWKCDFTKCDLKELVNG